jgi:myo-inositol 2-dehydrogenase / D-chiro-inositol 1-dehydrogenase
MDNNALQIGLIGAGRIGRVHAEHLAHRMPEVRLKALSDVSDQAGRECAARFAIPEFTTDYHQILEDPGIGAVVICAPTDMHARIIEEAAAAGKHIFCEKPIARDLRSIDQALDAVAAGGVKLQIGFNRRFDPNFARVRKAIRRGEIGEAQLLHIISRDPAPPPVEYVRGSGGIFLDMTIHDFDMARFLIHDEVEEIYTAAGVLVDPAIGELGDLDTAIITLKFQSGAIGCIDNSRQAVYGYDQRVEVLGAKGSVSADNNYPNTAVISNAEKVSRDLPLNFFMDRYLDSFLAEMRAFVRAVIEDRTPPVTGADGRAPVVMALAARRSFDEKRPVRLDEIDGA